MKLLKQILLSLVLLIFTLQANAQDKVNEHLAEAKKYYAASQKAEARYSLYQALEEVDIIIGKEILKKLPTELDGMKSTEDEHVGSSAGFSGVYVQRIYQDEANEDKKIEITIVNDSPFLSMVSAFLSTPMAGMIPGRKSVRLDGYKGMLQKDKDSDPVTQTIYVPFGQSLFTMIFTGYDSESQVTQLANKVPLSEIVEMAK